MKKRLLFLLILVGWFCLPTHAVLKEKDLHKTLVMLRTELTEYHVQLERESKQMKADNDALVKDIIEIFNQANQNAIMLYSQRDGYTFDMAYACHQASELYHNFKAKSKPFRKNIILVDGQVARYDSLVDNLSSMPKDFLEKEDQVNRNVCLTLAVNIRRQLKENQEQMQQYVRLYDRTEARLRSLDDYANKKYGFIQNNIFKNGGDNYFRILHHLHKNFNETKSAIVEKYKPQEHVTSDWDPRVIMFLFIIMAFYGFISIGLNIITIRIIVTRLVKKGIFASIKDEFMAKRNCIMMAMTVVTFALIIGIIRATVQQNFIIMASNLLVEYAWLLGVILFSLLLRVSGKQINHAFRIYSPMIVMGFLVIAFRIVLIPNDLVELIFPPILLLCAFWQFYVIRKNNKDVPRSDMFYTWITLLVFGASVFCSWIGFTLLSVQLLIWWIMQLTCILSITCVEGWLTAFAKKREYETKPITKTWFYNMVYSLFLPVLGVLSFILSVYWAADIFNLSDTTMMIFTKPYIKTTNVQISIASLSIVLILFFLFRYINNTADKFTQLHFEHKDPSTAASKHMMTKNVMQVFIWGVWILISISICHISNTWFMVVSGGLSTGIGFAMKDILENIYYGISLMAGRIKIGDYIVCDGIRGRVSSISYVSTTLEALDGSVISFQNSQLFTKNYHNMTKNHGYELDIMEVGIAYGSNIEQVKKYLVEEIMQLDCIYQDKGVRVLLKSFDDSCITLKILVWVNVLTKTIDNGRIMECIYYTLNKHNIEIPFPQREITIKHEEPKPVSYVADPKHHSMAGIAAAKPQSDITGNPDDGKEPDEDEELTELEKEQLTEEKKQLSEEEEEKK